jgi:hypothetical protein
MKTVFLLYVISVVFNFVMQLPAVLFRNFRNPYICYYRPFSNIIPDVRFLRRITPFDHNWQ